MNQTLQWRPLVLELISLDKSRSLDALLVVAGAAWVALLAQVSIPLPFTPVPITGQTLGVLMVGAGLGSRLGLMSILLYLAVGVLGVPVFQGASAGIEKIYGPTGGYLVGFLVSAYLTGKWVERGLDRKLSTALPGFFLGTAVIFLFGLLWLGVQSSDWSNVLRMGLWPFVPGAFIKIAFAAGLMPSVWKWIENRRRS